MIPPITEYVETLFAALGFVAIASILAWALGFFRIPQKTGQNAVTIWSTLGAFFLYFFVQVILIPMLLFAWLYMTEETMPKNLGSFLSKNDVGWISFVSIITATLTVLAYSLVIESNQTQTVWNSGKNSFLQRLKSILIGAFSWLCVYPWVIVIGQLVTIIFILTQHEVPPDIDQEMVRHIKDIVDDKPLFYATIFSVIIAVPIAEELLFRGFMQNLFKKGMGVVRSIFVTSFLFSILHFSWGQGFANWQIVLSLFVVSCFLGYLYERQKTLWAPIALHIAINGVSIAILFVI